MKPKEANLPTDIKKIKLAEKRAEAAYLRARTATLEAEIAEANANMPDLSSPDRQVFDPGWKIPGRPHLSAAGEMAIIKHYLEGGSQGEASRLFSISEKAAAAWKQRSLSAIGKAKA